MLKFVIHQLLYQIKMNILLSLPPNAACSLGALQPAAAGNIRYYDSDPAGHRLGSGGGTTWIVDRFRQAHPDAGARTIVIHAAGQSRRLPAYAATGKALTPLPVLRWAVGEKIDQTLIDLQLPLLEEIMEKAPEGQNTLIASGDVLVTNNGRLPEVPQADVVCYGLWTEPELASNHGVFFIPRGEGLSNGRLDFMLNKPSVEKLDILGRSHYYLIDVGIWVLSDRAMEWLRRRSFSATDERIDYDLYAQFGCALGMNPSAPDEELAQLSVAVVPLHDGRFYHFGTTAQLVSSTLALQNIVADQRRIMHRQRKPNPALFVQNCHMGRPLTGENTNIWVENSYIGPDWRLTSENMVTGVPRNAWSLQLAPGQCIDVVPVGETDYVVRPYGYNDTMRGATGSPSTRFLGKPLELWAAQRGVNVEPAEDIQKAPLFPVGDDMEQLGIMARWMTSEPELAQGKELWQKARKVSADEIMEIASLARIFGQRREFLAESLGLLAANQQSVFYQLDLNDAAVKFNDLGLEAPAPLPADSTMARRLHNYMLRARVEDLAGGSGVEDEKRAFGVLREAILSSVDVARAVPRLDVSRDQIVWGRSPLRIDLAGGWTDTPPYSLLHGGAVVNMAVEINGQPPLQVFVKPSAEYRIIMRSIDLGASETVATYDELLDFNRLCSPFSLPKAALAIAGFAPGFSTERFPTLADQLHAFGSGIEITLLSAVPAGSGMGTSSILAATVLGALSDFCALAWTADEICSRTLQLEQLLTSGGGWQDQYGGALAGVKLLQTSSGLRQQPNVSWLPESIFTDPEFAPCHILYYTGLTRTAKGILGEIVKRMFLNDSFSLRLLAQMREHALDMADAIQKREFSRYGHLVGETWRQNQLLDAGTCPDAVRQIIGEVGDLAAGLKLPGAGGGGFLYIVAKDPEAAARIRSRLAELPSGRLVDLSLSSTGLRVSRS